MTDQSIHGPEVMISPPENVPLRFQVAGYGSRMTAFVIDMLIILAAVFVLGLALAIGGLGAGGGFIQAFAFLAVFVLRSFYFVIFELRWQGRTPGKKATKLRVVARDGGPLTAEMVFARNLTREIEFFIPLVLLAAPGMVFNHASTWARVVGGAWVFVLALFPLFNKGRCRIGDLVGGTLVVTAPENVLLPDLVERAKTGDAAFSLTNAQLDLYGIKELHVLEDVLRLGNPEPELLEEITRRICRKLRIDPRELGMSAERFLRTFYAAQRKRLEEKMLLGRRQEEKIR